MEKRMSAQIPPRNTEAANLTRRVVVEYFAVLREYTGIASESLTTAARTPGELYSELCDRYRFPALDSLKVAVNDEFDDMQAELNDGDRVVFIPPVAGG